MPLDGSLPDWDADGSRYSTRPARLARWLFERLLLGCKAQVGGVDETKRLVATRSGWSLFYTLNNRGIALSLVEGHFAGFAIYSVCHLVRL